MRWCRLVIFLLLLTVLFLTITNIRIAGDKKRLVQDKEKLLLKADSLHSLQVHIKKELEHVRDSLEMLLKGKKDTNIVTGIK